MISPELSADLGVGASSLGLLTSAYFFAFAAMQLPAGMLLDRYGPKRVEPALLCVAGCGSLVFAASDGLPGLAFARMLIGAGVAVCLMAPLKAIALWYSSERQASLAGWMMVAGAGALLATAPLAAALSVLTWRGVFVVLALSTFAAAAAIFLMVPDAPARPQASGLVEQWHGVSSVFLSSRFWWLAPLATVSSGSFMAIQGLWSVPWLIEVEGYSREVAAQHLMLMGLVILGGYCGLGMFATHLGNRGITPAHLFATGFALNIAALTLITARAVSFTYLLWAAYGLGSAVNVLGFTVLSQGFARELTARVNTALNLLMFSGSFLAQWGIGIVVDIARAELAADTAGGLITAFAMSLGAQLLAYAWFMLGWRRHAVVTPAAPSGVSFHPVGPERDDVQAH